MTAGATRTPAGTSRRALPWVLIAAGLLLIGLLAGRGGGDNGRDLDPTSTGPTGTKAVVDSLRELGADVDVSDAAPDRRTTAVLLLVDGLREPQRKALTAWAEQGGTLVVGDHDSPLNPFRVQRPTILGLVDRDLKKNCAERALQDVERVEVPAAVLLRPRPPATGCFTSGEGAWLVTQPMGAGNLVVLGGAAAFTNEALGEADNAVLAMTLLAPQRAARVQVFPLPEPGGGRKTLGDLISPHVKLALLQLVFAFLIYALWRARRLGRPVLETPPVEIPGSELVAAVGRLFQRGKARDRAAELVRDGARRTLATRLGLGPEASVDEVADAAAGRTSRSVDEVRTILGGQPPADDRQLVEVAQAAETLSREVTRTNGI